MKAAAAALPLIALLGFNSGCGKPTGQAKQPEAVMDFHQLFSENCSACHGVSGQKGAGPRLNDPLYLALVTKQDLYNVIEKGRPGTPMWGDYHARELALYILRIGENKPYLTFWSE